MLALAARWKLGSAAVDWRHGKIDAAHLATQSRGVGLAPPPARSARSAERECPGDRPLPRDRRRLHLQAAGHGRLALWQQPRVAFASTQILYASCGKLMPANGSMRGSCWCGIRSIGVLGFSSHRGRCCCWRTPATCPSPQRGHAPPPWLPACRRRVATPAAPAPRCPAPRGHRRCSAAEGSAAVQSSKVANRCCPFAMLESITDCREPGTAATCCSRWR